MIEIKDFFDPATFTLTYVVWDPKTLDAVVIDPVWNYDPASSTLSQKSVNLLMDFLRTKPFKVSYILETHAHADHISSSQILKKLLPNTEVAINEKITQVQDIFKSLFDLPHLATDGHQFDRLLKDNEVLKAGSLSIKVLFTPGHTPACSSFLIENSVFTGDALFMPDSGVGRCDFPAGSAATLYESVTQRLFTLPDSTQTFTGHDYQPNGRPVRFQSTIGDQKTNNIHLKATRSQADFVKFRTERDKTLSTPSLLLPSVQINIDAGRLPPAHQNGKHYLSIPLSERL